MELKSWKAPFKPGNRKPRPWYMRVIRSPRWMKRLVKRPNFWERFAVTVSTIAMVISAGSTAASWRQVDLMRTQLTAADHNAATLKIATAVYAGCAKINEGPVKAYRYVRHGIPPAKGYIVPLIAGQETEVTVEQRRAYEDAMFEASQEIQVLWMQVNMFPPHNTEPLRPAVDAATVYLNEARAVAGDYDNPHVDLEKLAEIGQSCAGALRRISSDTSGD